MTQKTKVPTPIFSGPQTNKKRNIGCDWALNVVCFVTEDIYRNYQWLITVYLDEIKAVSYEI